MTIVPPAAARFTTADWVRALGVNILFGLSLIAMKEVISDTGAVTAAALRMTIVFIFCAAQWRWVPGKNMWMALYGLTNSGAYLLFLNLALQAATNVSALAIVGQLGIPLSILMATVIYKEKLPLARIIGIIIAFAGVALMVFDPAVADEITAVLLMIGATLAWSSGTLIQRKLSGASLMNIQAWNGLMAIIVMIPMALWLEPAAIARIPHMSLNGILWLAFVTIGCTIIGQGQLAVLLQRHHVTRVTPLLLSVALISTVAAAIYYDTQLTAIMVIGGTMTIAGVAGVSLNVAGVNLLRRRAETQG